MFGGMEGGLLLVGAAGSRLSKQDNTKVGDFAAEIGTAGHKLLLKPITPSLDGFIEIPSSLLDFTHGLGFKIILHYVIKVKGDSGRTDNLGN